jgi:hypothetical protein
VFLTHIFEERRSTTSREDITHAKVRAELFNPERQENKDTDELVITLAAEVAQVMIKEFCDPKKVTKDLVSDIGGKFSWVNTTDEEHEAGKAKNANNERPFGHLSRELEVNGRLLPFVAVRMTSATKKHRSIRQLMVLSLHSRMNCNSVYSN